MSTRKDANKISSTNVSKKKVATRTSSRREESTDRSNVKKVEIPLKTKSTNNLTDRKIDAVKNKIIAKVEKPLKVQSTPHEKSTPTTSTRKTAKLKVPVTPPSNRVSKTQYFPSKSLYTNALKADESKTKTIPDISGDTVVKEKVSQKNIKTKVASDKDKGKNTVKKPSQQRMVSKPRDIGEKKVIKSRIEDKRKIRDVSPDSSSTSERPRTATLRKGSIVNANIVGPDVPKQLVPKTKIKEVLKVKPPSPKSEGSEEFNYEDDFESYESDFEEYFSSSSTNSEDISGEETSSISSSSSSGKVNMLTKIKPAIIRINSAGTDDERKLDSGNYDLPEFKHKQVLDNIRESIEKENANLTMQEVQRNNPASLSDEGFEDQKSLQFINFLDAKKKCERRKSMEIKRRRGEEILSMIRLDTYSFTLFDLPPVSYDVFIKNYGRHNTIQIGVQTGEDDVDEDVQTEEITNASKWTQFPVCFSKIDVDDPNYWHTYKTDYLGVGGDIIVEEKNRKLYNESSLEKFLLSAGNLILRIQAESSLKNSGTIRKNTRDIPFSDGHILFNTNKDIIKDCSVTCISFCSDNNKIVTIHLPKQQYVEEHKSVVCVWRISNTEEPDVFFISYGDISCCCFGLDNTDFIYCGLEDGTISLWDLKKKIFNEDALVKRIPLYTTEVRSGHTSKVISLQPFTSQTEKTAYFKTNQTNEICSLDEDGDIIIWSVITKHSSDGVNTANCTSWNDVVLVKNTRISLRQMYPELEDFRCTDFVVNATDSNYVLVSTNYGFIIHHLIKGGRSNVKKFVPGESVCVANCIEVCPFSSNYILVGFENGNINLYSRMVDKPIMILSDKEENFNHNAIDIVQWSKCKPFVIYTKDANNTIHIWDLNESDIFPIYSIPFNQNITCMKLSPTADDGDKQSYMIIGTDDGKIYLHVFNKEHGSQPNEMYKDQLNTFLKYVNRL